MRLFAFYSDREMKKTAVTGFCTQNLCAIQHELAQLDTNGRPRYLLFALHQDMGIWPP